MFSEFIAIILIDGPLIIISLVVWTILKFREDKHFISNKILGRDKRIEYTSFDFKGNKNYTVMQIYNNLFIDYQMPYIHNKKIIESKNYYTTLIKYIISRI